MKKQTKQEMEEIVHTQEPIHDDAGNVESIEHTKSQIKNHDRYRHDFESVDTDSKDEHIPSKIYYRTPNGKRILFFEMKIKRIADIDTTKETFRCRFHIYLTWLSTKEECDSYDKLKFEGKSREFVPSWVPSFSWLNSIALHETDVSGRNEKTTYKLKPGWIENTSVAHDAWDLGKNDFGFPPEAARWIRVKYEYDVEFAEELELPAFPFDCQDLTMYLKVDTDKVQSCDIVPFPRPSEFALLDPEFSVLSEWDFESMVVEFYKTNSVKSKSSKEYSLVGIHVKASRRWEAHIGHMIVIFCMFTLGLAAFVQKFDAEELGGRLSYCVTLLLADVATLQLVFDKLPNIPYWTVFDVYIYTCFGYLFLVTGWTGLAAKFDELQDMDETMLFVALAFWAFAHVVFLIFAMWERRQERKKLTMTSIELDKHFKSTKLERDRRAIAVLWGKDCLEDSSKTDASGYGIYVKGVKKDFRGGRSVFTLLKL